MNVEERIDRKGRKYYYVRPEPEEKEHPRLGPSPFVSATIFPAPTSEDWLAVYVWWEKPKVVDYIADTGRVVYTYQRWNKRYLLRRIPIRNPQWESRPWWYIVSPKVGYGAEHRFVTQAIDAMERMVQP